MLICSEYPPSGMATALRQLHSHQARITSRIAKRPAVNRRCRNPTGQSGSQTGNIRVADRLASLVYRSSRTRAEPGRSWTRPLAENVGRFTAIRQTIDGVVLEYVAGGTLVREHMAEAHTKDAWTFAREFHVAPSQRPMWLVLGTTAPDVSVGAQGVGVSLQKIPLAQADGGGAVWAVRIPAHQQPISFVASFTHGLDAAVIASRMSLDPAPSRWRGEVTTTVIPSTSKDAYVVDDIGLPVDNPWHRSVRPGDIRIPPGRHRCSRNA